MKSSIYVLTHKKYEFPKDPIYIPMQVGSAFHEDLHYLRDDGFESNISMKNPYYSELSGIYAVFRKDNDSDIIGTAHYRRYLLDDNERLWTSERLQSALEEYDMISTKRVRLNYSYYEAFGKDHSKRDLDLLSDVIGELQPDILPLWKELLNGNRSYFGNMLIAKRSLFIEYCGFLFDILFTLEKRVDMTGYNAYQKRLFGFVSEILLLLFVRARDLKVKECMVGMFGEKKETFETKEALSLFFEKGDVKGAKAYFLQALEKRPDLLMEASDIYGDLKAAMQAISTAEFEGEKNIIEGNRDFKKTIETIKELNSFMSKKKTGDSEFDEEEFKRYITKNRISDEAIMISEKVICG